MELKLEDSQKQRKRRKKKDQMDGHHLFSPDLVFPEEDTFWYEVVGEETNASVAKQSAFRPYTRNPERGSPDKPAGGGGGTTAEAEKNLKKRMVDLMRSNWEEKRKAAAPARERCRRHMMNERVRREKQRQSYFALHSLLPAGTKVKLTIWHQNAFIFQVMGSKMFFFFGFQKDKNSIVQSALNRIEELQREKKELERRIQMMENGKGKKVELKVEDPVSGADSMLETLTCLKALGAKPITIQAEFSPQEFSTVMSVETQIAGDEVEKTVEKTLQEAEWKLLFLPQPPFSKY
ncbi:PREDICTED: transcription factor bHLH92 isoform X1 [Tarenaya hassleriana]|uniref:transcription factor bHLH92 isoform X1 n=1 Tax=Tarenaya hassleriana TaxID=28532 RepID=UPI00053C5058|nr:PREDICTED: transcription factor bHLH92 isoform X1 [Tarenaya hassleriana]